MKLSFCSAYGIGCQNRFVTVFALLYYVAAKSKYRKQIIKYPRDTQFFATDFFVYGCKNFLDRCPAAYKQQQICARSYDGNFLNFNNYCEMQYENCNSWKMQGKGFFSYKEGTNIEVGDFQPLNGLEEPGLS